jgi:DNA-binding transcriptional regulator GbsR (MarR family)
MPETTETVEKKITKEYEELSSYFGFDPTIVRIYMAIFFSEEPVGLKEISQKTGYSTSTICTMMPKIEEIFDTTKFKKPGSKKNYYECQNNFQSIIEKKLGILKKFMEHFIQNLQECEKMLEESKDRKAGIQLEKIRKLKESYQQMSALLQKHEEFIVGGK